MGYARCAHDSGDLEPFKLRNLEMLLVQFENKDREKLRCLETME